MLKNKFIVRKLRNILILIMAMIVMIGAYRNIGRSRAEDVIEIGVLIQDNYGYLDDEEIVLEAKEIENDLYEMELPESVNTKKIEQILKVTLEVDETQQLENVVSEENATPQEENNSLEIVENKIQLTKEQIENQKINIEVVYGIKLLGKNENGELIGTSLIEKTEEERKQIEITEETQLLYNKILRYEDEENAKLVEVKGFLPIDAKLQVEGVTQEQLKEIFGDKKVDVAYDIKIIKDVKTLVPTDEAKTDAEPEYIIETIEINPEDFGEICEVSIKDAKIETDSQVYHVKDDNTYEQVNVKDNTEENISFEAQTFSIYAVITDEGVMATAATGVSFSPNSKTSWDDEFNVSVSITGQTSSETYYYRWHNLDTGSFASSWNTMTSTSIPTPRTTAKWVLHIGVKRSGSDSIGHLGNSGAYWIDWTSPNAPTLSKDPSTEWANTDVKVTISGSTDSESGLGRYFYNWEDEFYSGYQQISASNQSNSKELTFSEEMNKTLYVKAVDVVGRWSGTKTIAIKIDKTPPTGTMTSSGTKPDGLNYYYTNQSSFTTYVQASDTGGSGLKSSNTVQFGTWAGGNYDSTATRKYGTYNSSSGKYEATFNFNDIIHTTTGNAGNGEGLYRFTSNTWDNAGNKLQIYSQPIVYDKTAPTITVSPASSDWTNAAVSTTLTVVDPTTNTYDGTVSGLASTNSYQYYLSNSSTALSGGEWKNYTTGGTTISLNPGTSGQYYLFVKRVSDIAGNTSTSGGTATKVSNTTYQRFGPYKFDYSKPTGTASVSASYTNQSTITAYVNNAADTGGSGVSHVWLCGFAGGSQWKGYGLGMNASYDSTNNRFYGTFTFSEMPHTTTGDTNNGEGTYYFSNGLYDCAGNVSYPGASVIYDKTAPTITVSPASNDWTNAAVSTTITIADPTTNAYDGKVSGLSTSNSYQYYLSKSSTALSGGSWKDYTSGTAISLNPGEDGEYYLFVKRVNDKAGNTSTSGGTATTVSSTTYQKFGPYKFDYNAPTIAVSPEKEEDGTNSALSTTITITEPTTNGVSSGLSTSNSYQYFLSKSSTALSGGSWKNYTSGTAISLNPGTDGDYYLFVKRVNDNAGNTSTSGGTATKISSTTYQKFGPYRFDYTAPTIAVSPQKEEDGTNSALSTTITITDPTTNGVSSGLSTSNSYQYFLSKSSTALSGGSWKNYTSGTAISLNPGSDGEYYLFVKRVNDKAGNTSTSGGTATTISSTTYQRFGPYIFDYTAPTIAVSPTSAGWTNSAVSTTITLADPTNNGVASGLNLTTGSCQYYLSKSSSALSGSSWKNYTSGTAISLNPGSDGEYYLFVKRVNDKAGNTSTSAGTATTVSSTTYQRFGPYRFDYTKPAITYTHQSLDIDTGNKTYTMTFRGTDAHYTSGVLTLDNLTILMQNGQLNASGNPIVYDLKEEDVDLAFRSEAYTGANGVTGYTYTLTISDLEQLEIKTGLTTADYSGIITVAVPANLLVDEAGNKNNQTTITTGVDIPGGSSTDAVPVDVVDPLWNKESSSVDETNGTATLTVKGTDTYFDRSELTTNKIQVIVNGTTLTSTDGISISLGTETALNETRRVNGTNTTVQYGVQQTITVTGLPTDMEQLKIVILSESLIDKSGNKNKEKEFILFNYLKWIGLEAGSQSGFLGNTSIKRENIANVTFVSSTASANSTKWDASARGDNTIIAWYETNANGTLRVYIGSEDLIYANKDSSYLFSYIGYGSNCTTTEVITNLNLLKTSHVTNMKAMFAFTGYRAMTSLDLTSLRTGNATNMREMFNGTGYKNMTAITFPSTFDTSKVTDMSWMFANFGYTKITTINLASMNTSSVQDMSYMFSNCGYTAMTSLNISAFNTSNVTNMSYMFAGCGRNAMTSLTLGSNFNTANVTHMSYMFSNCGYTKLASINLGSKFNTANVIDMGAMFQNFGYTKLSSLDLGDVFSTINVTNMFDMFNGCGYTAMTSLDLGPAFTNIANNNSGMFDNTGKNGNCVIYAPEAIYKNNSEFKTSINNIPNIPSYIPAGYVHVQGTTMENGYVVRDSSGNEYVWIEVPKNTTVYNEIGTNIDLDSLSGTELTTALNNIEEELREYSTTYSYTGYVDSWYSEAQHGFASSDDYNELKYTMLKSVYKYGGFYIGRYETGTTTARTSASDTLTTAVVQPNVYPYNNVTNKQAQQLASGMGTEGYTSSLLFGVQWDLVLRHLENKGVTQEELNGRTTGSTYWGNYKDTVYEIKNEKAKYATSANSWAWTEGAYGAKTAGTSVLLSTGADTKFTKMGIYDLAGNVNEFTLGTTPYPEYPNVFRGGSYNQYGNEDRVNVRTDFQTAYTSRDLGFRVALYKDETTDDTTLTYTRGTVNPKYKPEWSVTGTTVTNTETTKKLEIALKGATNANYTSNVTTTLEAGDITVWIDGTQLTSISKSLTTASPATGTQVTHTLTLTNFEEAVRQAGKQYKEWSGNITLKIGGRGEDASTYSANVLVDSYGNQSMMATDETDGTWIEINFKDATKSTANTNGKLFADFIKPEIGYTYSTTDINRTAKTVTVVFTVTDKYYSTTSLTVDNLTIMVDGQIPGDTDGDGVLETGETLAITRTLTSSNITATVDGASKTIGKQYTLVIKDFEQDELTDGKKYLDYAGVVSVAIPSGKVSDASGNTNNGKTITVGVEGTTTIVDLVAPKWTITQETSGIKIQGTDEYFKQSTLTADKIKIYLDGRLDGDTNNNGVIDTGETPIVTKTLSTATDIKDTVDGVANKVVGKQYTLQISGFEGGAGYTEFTPTEAIVGGTAKYRNTGVADIKVVIDAGTMEDNSGNLSGVAEKALTNTETAQLEIYKVQQSADTTNQIETIIFNVTDKYYDKTDLINIVKDTNGTIDTSNAANELVIKYGGNITTQAKVHSFTYVEIKTMIDGVEKVVGHQYTLKLKGFEETDASFTASTRKYKDLSGDFQIVIDSDAAKNTNGNTINPSTCTLAYKIDAVKPFVKIDGINGHAINQEGDVTFTISDKYFNTTDTDASTITSDEIELWINGEKNTSITPTIGSPVTLKTTIDGTANTQYAVRYTISLEGFAQTVNQVKIRVLANAITDKTGNGNKQTDLILYNTLKKTEAAEYGSTANRAFLGETTVVREKINQIIFTDSLSGSTAEGVQKVWDVSAQGDGSIKAWTSQTASPYTVYIGSDFEIFANQDSTGLFAYIGTSITNNLGTNPILNLNLLNTSSVTNMSYMFRCYGYYSLEEVENFGSELDTSNVTNMSYMFANFGLYYLESFSLADSFDTSKVINMTAMFYDFARLSTQFAGFDLGTGWDTSSVTNMSSMFYRFGYTSTAMTSLTLPTSFDTSSVKNMSSMFFRTGYNGMTSLTLPTSFDTSIVTNMYRMFRECGYTAMTSLTLPTSFDTGAVTDMREMFYSCGYGAMTSLNLRNNFDTSKVTKMSGMFQNCGYTALTSLDLGNLFKINTSITTMANMFNGCGYTAMTSLDLGPAFTKIAATYTDMFTNTGKTGEITIKAPEAIYANRTTFKLNGTSTTTITPTQTGTIIDVAYKPEWTKVSTTVDTTNEQIILTVKGSAYNSGKDYASNVTSNLDASDIHVFVDGDDATLLAKPQKAVGTASSSTNATSGKTEVTQTITLSGWEETTKQAGKSFLEWSGNLTIKIAGRGQATSTYSNDGLVDDYGNKAMMETDATGTWVAITSYSDTATDRNATGKLFADFIGPKISIVSATPNAGGNSATVVFTVTDKYLNTSDMVTKNEMKIYFDGEDATDDLLAGSDFTVDTVNPLKHTVNGVERTVGYTYTMVIKNIAKTTRTGLYSDWSGTIQLGLVANAAKDLSGNTNDTVKVDAVFVDYIQPEFTYEYSETIIDKGNKVLTTVFYIADKHYDATNSTGIALSDFYNPDTHASSDGRPVFQIAGEPLNINVTGNTLTSEAISGGYGLKYTLVVKNLEEKTDGFSDGYSYSGIVSITIPANKFQDTTGNKNPAKTFTIGIDDPTTGDGHNTAVKVDVVDPVWELGDISLASGTVKLRAIDKYYKTSTLTTSNINIYVGGVLDTTIGKDITSTAPVDIKDTVDGVANTVVGKEYTLKLTGFSTANYTEVTPTNHSELVLVDGKVKYRNIAFSDITIEIVANTIEDNAGNKNKLRQFNLENYGTVQLELYRVQDTTDTTNQIKTIIFNVTDKYYDTTDLVTLVTNADGTINTSDENNELVIKNGANYLSQVQVHSFTNKQIKAIVDINGTDTEKVIGHQYTLKLKGLEESDADFIASTRKYKDWSGNVQMVVDSDASKNASGETIDPTTTTQTYMVDIVKPFLEKDGTSGHAINQNGSVTFTISDKYFNTTDTDAKTITSDEIEVYVNGTKNTSLTPVIGSPVTLKTTIDGTANTQYAVRYTITLSGFVQNANQVKIRILANAITDKTGNGNKQTDLIFYNTLKKAGTNEYLTNTDKPFLGESTVIRENINQIIFADSLSGSTAAGVQKVWDVSAQGDGSIKAWTSETAAPYTVYIGSDNEIFANQDSTGLFAYIGASITDNLGTNPILNLNLLNTSSVTNMGMMFLNFGNYSLEEVEDFGSELDTSNVTSMSYMFANFGSNHLKSFSFADSFDTSKVTDMYGMFYNFAYASSQFAEFDFGTNWDTSSVTTMIQMFYGFGYNSTAMTSLTLPSSFDTSSVTRMDSMFEGAGYEGMTSLTLPTTFDTSSVTDTSDMFRDCGYKKMTSLTLPTSFDTSSVGDMSYMFYNCGYTAMRTLTLPSSFDTSSATTMSNMFYNCGYTAMTSLTLPTSFNTSSVKDMTNMFYGCGYTAMTSLNLRNKFDTSSVTKMSGMFQNCGYTALTSLDLGNLFKINASITTMANMFNGCGYTAMTSLDLGPAFTKIASTRTDMFKDTGKANAITIKAPEAIYANRTTFKLNGTSTTTIAPTQTGTIIDVAYKPEWSKVSTQLDTTNQQIILTIKGTAYNSGKDYASNVTSNLAEADIHVFIDGQDATSAAKPVITIGTPSSTTNATSGKTEITQTVTLSNWQETARQSGKSFLEWSGNITIKIGGRGEATSTYSNDGLVDEYGNKAMMETDATGTWVTITSYSDTATDHNTAGKLFADFIKPEMALVSATKDPSAKTETIVFTVTDKYINTSDMVTKDEILVYFDGEDATSDVLDDATFTVDTTNPVKATVNGVEKTVGYTYTLVLKDLQQPAKTRVYRDWSGTVSIKLKANAVKDKSGNTNDADVSITGDFVDFIKPEFVYEYSETVIDKGNKILTVVFYATDKYYNSATSTGLTLASFYNPGVDASSDGKPVFQVAGEPININVTGNSLTSEAITGGYGLKYTLVVKNLEERNAEGLSDGYSYSGIVSITIPANKFKDTSTNANDSKTITIGIDDPETGDGHNTAVKVDLVDPIWELGTVNLDSGIVKLKAKDKYFSSVTIDEDDIFVYVNGRLDGDENNNGVIDGAETPKIGKDITSTTPTDIKETVDGVANTVVGKEYTLYLSNITPEASSDQVFVPTNLDELDAETRGTYEYKYPYENGGDIAIKIAAGTAKDTSGNGNKLTTFDIGNIDNTRPKIYEVRKTQNATANTETIVFNVTDKNFFDTTDLIEKSEMSLTIDNTNVSELLENATYGAPVPIKATVNGEPNVIVGHQYTMVISNIAETTKRSGKDYLEWSGTLKLAINAESARDNKGNKTEAKSFTDFIDYVKPKLEQVTVANPINTSAKTYTMSFKVTDKYLDTTDLIGTDTNSDGKIDNLNSDLTIKVDGEAASNITWNLSYAPITATMNKTVGANIVSDTYTIGHTYTLVLSGFEEGTKQTASGKDFFEWSGTVSVEVAGSAVKDSTGNNLPSAPTTITGEHIDFIIPRLEEVDPTSTIIAQDATNKTETIVFNIMDKYLDTTNALETSEFTVYVDGEVVPVDYSNSSSTGLNGTFTKVQDFKRTVNGNANHVVGRQYKLVLSGFDQLTRNAKNYKDYSGTVSIVLNANAINDTSNHTLASGNTTVTGDFVDYINPSIEYTHQSSDVSTSNKKYTMTFDITDKYYSSGVLTVDDIKSSDASDPKIEILMQNGQRDGSGNPIVYNLKDEPVTLAISSTPITKTFNKTVSGAVVTGGTYTIGHTYTLTISNLEQLEIKTGLTTADYSGIIDVSIGGNMITDTSNNGNSATTITSGVDFVGGVESGTPLEVDLVDPLWTKVSSSALAKAPADAINTTATTGTSTITIKGTDTYFATTANGFTTDDSTLSTDEIEVYIDGVKNTSITPTISSVTSLSETRRLYNSATTETVQYGVQYTITVNGWKQGAKQVKIRILEDAIKDESGNGNKVTDFIIYNCLESAASETTETSVFLGGSIKRREIQQIVFVDNLDSAPITVAANGTITLGTNCWDVSAISDKSILAWTSQTSAPYTVYIGSDSEIFANQNASYLFSYIGYAGEDGDYYAATASETISNLGALNVNSATQMGYMFNYTGYTKMTNLTLPTSFDTSNVTNMSYMFNCCGYTEMTNLTLPTSFNTSNVTDMEWMFESCGYSKMTSLTLPTSFDTSSVATMVNMFDSCGYIAMTNLTLPSSFDTSSVTDMSSMFSSCGGEAMTSLTLPSSFDTSSVENMSYMFAGCGHTAMTSLTLPSSFDTSSVTIMEGMFYECGYTAMTSLTLPSSFDTSSVENMAYMFAGCGYTAMTSLTLPSSFDTNSVMDMGGMFERCGYTAMTSLDLGDKFDTTSATGMVDMFKDCGTTAMTVLDLGPAFTKISSSNTNMFTNCGASGLVVYAPEAIYSDRTGFKLNN